MKPTTTTTTKRTTTTRRTTTTTAPPPPPATTTTPSASCNEIVKDELCDWQYGKLAEYKNIWTGAECQALCRAVNGAVYFSHYNKVSDPTHWWFSNVPLSLHSRGMTSEMTTRATAAVSRPVHGPGASVVTEIVMMMWGTVTSVTAWGQSALYDKAISWHHYLAFRGLLQPDVTSCTWRVTGDKENAGDFLLLPIHKSLV